MSYRQSSSIAVKRSATAERRRSAGASGWEPRIAWLPITTSSREPEMAPLALKTCSSCLRFILRETPVDGPAVSGSENSAKRAALSEPPGILAIGKQKAPDFFPVHLEDLEPLRQSE